MGKSKSIGCSGIIIILIALGVVGNLSSKYQKHQAETKKAEEKRRVSDSYWDNKVNVIAQIKSLIDAENYNAARNKIEEYREHVLDKDLVDLSREANGKEMLKEAELTAPANVKRAVKLYLDALGQLGYDEHKSEIAARLYEKAKLIPGADALGNYYAYEALVELEPNNETFKSKFAHYKKKSRSERKRLERAEKMSHCDLELKKWHWSSDGDYLTAEGLVKNISGYKMKSVVAVVSFYTANGDYITSEQSFLQYNPIMPGQSSPFKIFGRYNPMMKKGSIEFKYWAGERIETYRE